MEQIAFIMGGHYLYWSSIILALASAGAVCLFLSFYLRKSRNGNAAFAVVPLAVLLSLLASRLLHWYCFPASYESFASAMIDHSQGGYALLGAFAGCFLAAVLTRLVRLHKNLPHMLDCMCLAGGAGIAAGRLASFFNASDRGQLLASIHTMPWAYPVVNRVSGVTEYRLATFLLQAMVTGILTLMLSYCYLTGKRNARKDGDTAMLFLLFYGAAEVILDSTRYDSLYFRSNGFVSIVQVMGAIALGAVIVVFSIRMVRNRGFRWWYVYIWTEMAVLIGCAGYMEYHVQRHGNEALFAYSVMTLCLCVVLVRAVTIYLYGTFRKKTARKRFDTAREL